MRHCALVLAIVIFATSANPRDNQSTSQGSPTPPAHTRLVLHDGVRYSLPYCLQNSQTVSCTVSMESLNPDGLRISWSTQNSYFADYSGKQISAAEVVPRQEAPVGGEIDLPGLHAVLIVNFKPYTPKGGKLQLVQINGNDGKPFLLRFSDIPVR